MSQWRPRAELVWAGSKTVKELLLNLEHGKRTVVKLPAHCHPVLSSALYGPGRARSRIDITADSTLLQRLSAIDEFAALEELVDPVRYTRTRLRLQSPRPHLVFNFGAVGRVVEGSSPREWQLGERWNAGRRAPAPQFALLRNA
jgi:hypothetical protein